MRTQLTFSAMMVMALLSLFFFGKGITGYYILDFDQEKCATHADCKSQMCCHFNNRDYGVCDAPSRCDAIKALTREEELSITQPTALGKPTSMQEVYVSIAMALMLVLLAAAIYKQTKVK